jgi:hypothetical protein
MMKLRAVHYVALTTGLALIACIASAPRPPAAADVRATFESVRETLVSATLVYAPPPTEPPPAGLPDEAILILTPGSGSRLVSQVHVEGLADSTFEQNLVVQVVALSDTGPDVIAQQAVTIQAELGQRGPFAADMVFTFEGDTEQPGEVRVFSTSPRDGGLTHLATAQVRLAASGPPDIRTADAHDELIVISSPPVAAAVSGGVAHVEGTGLASFEQTLVVEIYDADGQLIGSAPTTVTAQEYGMRGPFSADVVYALAASGPGRIVVIDPSPAFGQTLHLASVEVQLEP